MTGSHSSWRQNIIFALAAAVYLAIPAAREEKPPRQAGQFAALATAMAQGRLDIALTPDMRLRTGELIPIENMPGHYYCAYPPLPALLMVPLAWLGAMVRVETMCRAVSILNVLLFDRVLDRWPQRVGLGPLSGGPRWLCLATFAFGCTTWPNAWHGGDWHLAHATALSGLLLALDEEGRRGRSWLVGVWLGIAVLSRPTTALTGAFFLLPRLRTVQWRRVAALAAGPVAAVALLALYNVTRLGAPLDFGYDRMLLEGDGERLMRLYGQFHPAFVPVNAFWFFLAPPWLAQRDGVTLPGYDPRGMSLFIATPAFLYALAALRRVRTETIVRDAAAGIAMCLAPLLMYFNSGFWQFGHRFSMDYLPLLFVLMLAGMRPRVTRIALAVMAASVAIHAYALLMDPVVKLPAWLTPRP